MPEQLFEVMSNFFFSTCLAVLLGFIIDLLLGDPVIRFFPHPVIVMGRAVSRLEKILRQKFKRTQRGELAAGRVLAAIISTGTLIITSSLCLAAYLIHPIAGLLLQTLWCWQCLAGKDLSKESKNVYNALQTGDVIPARNAVARIVGRDTQHLTADGIAKAAIETVAENFSDGVFAPLFYMLLGGAPLAMTYKSINTMDSMIGYKNERYLSFGRCAAKLDDAANYIPSRLAALFWITASGLTGYDMRGAWRIWQRDRSKHASPNSAQCESACAGALGIRLSGPASYFGVLNDKPYIGDDTRPVEPEDILHAGRIMKAAGVLALVAGQVLRLAVVSIIFFCL